MEPFKPYIKSLLEDEPDFNRGVIFERLKGMGYIGGITILRDYAAQVGKEINQQAVICFETEPGRQAQVDWKVHGIKTVDGKKQRLYAFEYFGGVPNEIPYDNMKTAFI